MLLPNEQVGKRVKRRLLSFPQNLSKIVFKNDYSGELYVLINVTICLLNIPSVSTALLFGCWGNARSSLGYVYVYSSCYRKLIDVPFQLISSPCLWLLEHRLHLRPLLLLVVNDFLWEQYQTGCRHHWLLQLWLHWRNLERILRSTAKNKKSSKKSNDANSMIMPHRPPFMGHPRGSPLIG